ncbi:sodium/potassium-transporting ATPase subunit alpha [Drosophila ficusphila]|uniref:sodium/potassium-transporting ATPase subunit alpha n=1 Tax=Drosophila ficusphila TaxID=30025 RepID=UPI0007E71A80|nr:sodium/potassium-transporting ATPase subunit alpha [Drosophila ficusphila]
MVLWLKHFSKWKGKCCRCRKHRKQKKKEKESDRQTENELWLEYHGPHLHIWPFHDLLVRLETNLSAGLSSQAAANKLARNGKNILPLPIKQDVGLWKFIKNCFSILGIFILLSSVCCFVLYFIFEAYTTTKQSDPDLLVAGLILLIVFFLTGFVLHLQDEESEEMITAFDELMPMYCTVIRDGEKEIILTQDVVIGDIVPISYGQRLPADLRFFSTSNLEVNNVALTGYSKPVHVTPLANEGRQRYSRVEFI